MVLVSSVTGASQRVDGNMSSATQGDDTHSGPTARRDGEAACGQSGKHPPGLCGPPWVEDNLHAVLVPVDGAGS